MKRRGICARCCREVAIKKDGTAHMHGYRYNCATVDMACFHIERQHSDYRGWCMGSWEIVKTLMPVFKVTEGMDND